MSFNILDAVKGHLGGELINKAASFLGESEGGVSKALGGLVPTVLSGLTDKASSSEGAHEVASMASAAHSSGFLGGLGNIFGDGGGMLGKGLDLVKGLFGSKLGGILDTVSSVAGIKSDSSSKLLSLAAPAVLGVLGKHAADSNLGASGLASLLSSSKSSWSSMLPAGIGSLIGGASNAFSGVSGKVSEAADYVEDRASGGGGLRWLLPLLLLAVAAALAWYLMKNCNKKPADPIPTPPSNVNNTGGGDGLKVKVDTITGIATYMYGDTISLACGSDTIRVPKDGAEAQLWNACKMAMEKGVDTSEAGKKAGWINLYDVQFNSGSSVYAKGASAQVANVAKILKAYPKVAVKFGGYTDTTGDAGKNQTLSQSRADKVLADVKAAGVAAAQLTKAEGYGEQFQIGTNLDAESKARSRRVSARITSVLK
jgi:OmpA-OmpF porin, OOP family